MCKYGYIILAIMSSFMGLAFNPEILSASDDFNVVALDNSNIVETVIPEPEPESEPVYSYASVAAPSAGAVYTYTAPEGINIGGHITPIYNVDYVEESVGPYVYRYGSLLYGHNSYNVFGSLSDYGVGNTFTITENSVTTTYVVSEVAMFEKNQDNGKLQINGSGSYLNGITRGAWGHSIALMTCAGTPLGNGKATHRLVVFADAI